VHLASGRWLTLRAARMDTAQPAGDRDVAGHMFVSGHTVQDHLKSIFAKTATRSRRTLLARALGT
jgi:DNA-binding NarL/FixJ family response regulator